MYLLIYICTRNCLEIFTLINTKELQHLIESQTHYAV